MNKPASTQSKSDPVLAMFKPPEFRKNPLHPELPSLFMGRSQRWGTSLTSPPNPGRTVTLLDGREEDIGRPLFGTPSIPAGRPKAGTPPKIATRGDNPIHREKPPVVLTRPEMVGSGPTMTVGALAGAEPGINSRQYPMQPEKPPSVLIRPEMVGSGPTMTVGELAGAEPGTNSGEHPMQPEKPLSVLTRPEMVGSGPTMTVGALAGAEPGTNSGEHPMQPEKPLSVLTRPERVGSVLGSSPRTTRTVGALAHAEPMTNSGEHPMQPEKPPSALTTPEVVGSVLGSSPRTTMTVGALAGAAPMANARQHPLHPEKPPTASPLRNGNRQGNPNNAPRCGARTRLGCACRSPAMRNGRCRMHGGASTGARTQEGRARIAAARTIHGGYGAPARAQQARLSAFIRRGRVLCAFARADLTFAGLAPLIGQVLGAKSGSPASANGKTPCNERTAQILATMDLSAKQATALIGLIRANGKAVRVPRQNPLHRDSKAPRPSPRQTGPARMVAPPIATFPMPASDPLIPPAVARPGVFRSAVGNTPCTQKPNRAMRRKMAKLQRQGRG